MNLKIKSVLHRYPNLPRSFDRKDSSPSWRNHRLQIWTHSSPKILPMYDHRSARSLDNLGYSWDETRSNIHLVLDHAQWGS